MIERNDLLAFNFYKKSAFNGSYMGMRYRIAKSEAEDTTVLCVTTWPGPYNYESTKDEKKVTQTFPFTEDSMLDITNYLNQTYEIKKSSWLAKI